MRAKPFKGLIEIYTGDGKGKTTAALGLALRAAGRGFRVFIGQFLKGRPYGELESLKHLAPLITVEQFGRKGFVHVTGDPDYEDIAMALNGLAACRKAMTSGRYRLVILDEINIALHFKLIGEDELRAFLSQKPDDVEVVLTGRNAPDWLIEMADLATDMKEVKHPYQKGVKAREGIET